MANRLYESSDNGLNNLLRGGQLNWSVPSCDGPCTGWI